MPDAPQIHDGECDSLYGRALGRSDACNCAPATRPDLDAPFPSVEWYAQWLHDVGGISQEAGEVFIAALGGERARADQAGAQALDEAADACDDDGTEEMTRLIAWLRARAAKARKEAPHE